MIKIDYAELGVSYRQFDYWCSKGWIRPDGDGGSGNDRWFETTEVRIFKIMATLIAIGFRPERAAEIARRAIDDEHNGFIEIFKGRLHATGLLRPVGNTQRGEIGTETRTG